MTDERKGRNNRETKKKTESEAKTKMMVEPGRKREQKSERETKDNCLRSIFLSDWRGSAALGIYG